MIIPTAMVPALQVARKLPWKIIVPVISLVLAVFYIGYLKLEISDLENDILKKENHIGDLKHSISTQNTQILHWKTVSATRQQQVIDALKQVEEKNNKSRETVSKIVKSKAESCEEGVELIDEVLGL